MLCICTRLFGTRRAQAQPRPQQRIIFNAVDMHHVAATPFMLSPMIGAANSRKSAMTDQPPVEAIKGHYARLRNGMVIGPLQAYWYVMSSFCLWGDPTDRDTLDFHPDGRNTRDDAFDIIATISPQAMQALASGELERLRAALKDVEVECNGHSNGDLTADEALENIHKILAAQKVDAP
jgi:hypothetical protein